MQETEELPQFVFDEVVARVATTDGGAAKALALWQCACSSVQLRAAVFRRLRAQSAAGQLGLELPTMASAHGFSQWLRALQAAEGDLPNQLALFNFPWLLGGPKPWLASDANPAAQHLSDLHGPQLLQLDLGYLRLDLPLVLVDKPALTRLHVGGCLTPAGGPHLDLRALEQLPNLQHLCLRGASCGACNPEISQPCELAHALNLPGLTRLCVISMSDELWPRLRPNSLAHLINLRHLVIEHAQHGESGTSACAALDQLPRPGHLTALALQCCCAATPLLARATSLHDLKLINCWDVSAADISGLTSLTSLNVTDSKMQALPRQGLPHTLQHMARLAVLRLDLTSDTGLLPAAGGSLLPAQHCRPWPEALSGLTELELTNVELPRGGWEGLFALQGLTGLRSLDIKAGPGPSCATLDQRSLAALLRCCGDGLHSLSLQGVLDPTVSLRALGLLTALTSMRLCTVFRDTNTSCQVQEVTMVTTLRQLELRSPEPLTLMQLVALTALQQLSQLTLHVTGGLDSHPEWRPHGGKHWRKVTGEGLLQWLRANAVAPVVQSGCSSMARAQPAAGGAMAAAPAPAAMPAAPVPAAAAPPAPPASTDWGAAPQPAAAGRWLLSQYTATGRGTDAHNRWAGLSRLIDVVRAVQKLHPTDTRAQHFWLECKVLAQAVVRRRVVNAADWEAILDRVEAVLGAAAVPV